MEVMIQIKPDKNNGDREKNHFTKVRKLVSRLYHWKGKCISICLFDLAQRLRSLLIKSLIKIKMFLP